MQYEQYKPTRLSIVLILHNYLVIAVPRRLILIILKLFQLPLFVYKNAELFYFRPFFHPYFLSPFSFALRFSLFFFFRPMRAQLLFLLYKESGDFLARRKERKKSLPS